MKIVVVSNYPMVRKGIISIISDEDDIQLCGEVSTFTAALEIIKSISPDITLVDANLGDKTGLELILQAKEQGTLSKFILIGFFNNHKFILDALRAGVEGYVLREACSEEILYALRHINRGKRYYGSEIIDYIIHSNTKQGIPGLTQREIEILIALGRGLSNREIAQGFFITENTVKKHVSQILAKLQLHDRTQAAIFANSKGLVS